MSEPVLISRDYINQNQLFIREQLKKVLPPIKEREQRVALAIYRLLAQEGTPLTLSALSQTVEMPLRYLESMTKKWPDLHRNDLGEIEAYAGLSTSKTRHSLFIENRKLYTWCAWDTLFIPSLIGLRAVIQSTCPQTGHLIELEVEGYRLMKQPQEPVVMSFLMPDNDFLLENIKNQFCCHIYFFKNAKAGQEWLSAHPGCMLLSLEAATEVGRIQNSLRFPINTRGSFMSLS
jgi:alkylmercury lyase